MTPKARNLATQILVNLRLGLSSGRLRKRGHCPVVIAVDHVSMTYGRAVRACFFSTTLLVYRVRTAVASGPNKSELLRSR